MRKFPLLIAAIAALLAAPAAAVQKKVGERTVPPEELLRQLGIGVSDEEVDAAVAAAAAHPLGTMENPVRVGGPEGQQAYIARLRCANGSSPTIGPRASAGVGAFGTIVDAFPLDCGAAAPGKVRLVMDMYHSEHREDRAPAGFTIAPR
jgi:hypothetical protein